MNKVWIIYDGRAELGDTDDASVIEVMMTRRDLKTALYNWQGHDGVLFEYDDPNNDARVTNETLIGHLRKVESHYSRRLQRQPQLREPRRCSYLVSFGAGLAVILPDGRRLK